MRSFAIFAITAAALNFTAGNSAQAREYPWCARYDVWTMNCGFVTLPQCLATISGAGGICTPNPRATGFGDEKPRRPNRARSNY